MKNRNFAATVLFNFVLGAVLFGTTVLLPQFLQIMMGYSAEKAGEVLSPAGFMLMMLFPIAGILSTKIDPRWMIAFGFGITAIALHHITNLSLAVDFKTACFNRSHIPPRLISHLLTSLYCAREQLLATLGCMFGAY